MERSQELFDRAQKVLPGGVNSPVRAFRAVELCPRFIERADGAYIYDADGKHYIDYVCSWGPMLLGHNHPAVREAVERAVKDGLSFARPRSGRWRWPSSWWRWSPTLRWSCLLYTSRCV